MATKKFPSEMSSRGTVLGTDKILIYNATTGASDEVCTVAELFAAISLSAIGALPLTAGSGNTLTGDLYMAGNGDKLFSIVSSNNGAVEILLQRGSLGDAYVDFKLTNSGGVFSIAAASTGSFVNNFALDSGSGGAATFVSTIGATGITLSADNANKPGAGGLWTVVSDARIKKDIEEADLDICYDTIKNIPLKRYAWADGVYSAEQVSDRHNLGWIAQDVQKYFSKAVSVKPFTKSAKIADGIEEYQEQDFVMQDKKVTSIEMINGSPVQVTKIVQEKVLLFDELPVKDELGKVVMENGKPLLAKVPKMITKTRPKFRQEVIEDCLDLNSGQLNAALYGAVQACMLKIESLEKEIALLKQ